MEEEKTWIDLEGWVETSLALLIPKKSTVIRIAVDCSLDNVYLNSTINTWLNSTTEYTADSLVNYCKEKKSVFKVMTELEYDVAVGREPTVRYKNGRRKIKTPD